MVAPGGAAGRRQLDAIRGEFGGTNPEPGLGEQAYSRPTGVVLAVKGTMVLRVGARGLPDDLGRTHEGPTNLARIIAAGVLVPWTGSS